MKKYAITYPVAIGVAFIATVLACLKFMNAPILYAVFFGLAVASYAWVDCRVILHLIDHDVAPKTWQLHIYAALISAGWTIVLLSTHDWVISAGLALCVGSALMFLGVKYDDSNDNGIPDTIEKAVKVVKKNARKNADLYDTLRYKLVEDKLGNAEDQERPLCVIAGVPRTVNEALAEGQEDLALAAMEYIDALK